MKKIYHFGKKQCVAPFELTKNICACLPFSFSTISLQLIWVGNSCMIPPLKAVW